MPKMTPAAAEKAAQIQQRLADRVDAVRADDHLSEQGKLTAIARHYRAADQDMKALSAGFRTQAALTNADIRRQLFGSTSVSGSDAIAMRDAVSRASQLESPADAQQLLRQAELTGDEQLARAVAGHAFELYQTPLIGPAWAEVVDTFTAQRPQVATQLETLIATQHDDMNTGLANALTTALPKPSELDRMHDYQIERLANPDNTQE